MTPSQLDHLRRIDAHLANLLENAKKRTPGRWVQLDGRPYIYDFVRDGSIASTDTSGKFDRSERLRNATFIASCAGNAETGWESTRASIRAVIAVYTDLGCEPTDACVQLAESILAQWPLELLANG